MEIELPDEDPTQEEIYTKKHPRGLLYFRVRSDRFELAKVPMSHPEKIIRSIPKFTQVGTQIHMEFFEKPLIGKYVHPKVANPDYPGYKVNFSFTKYF